MATPVSLSTSPGARPRSLYVGDYSAEDRMYAQEAPSSSDGANALNLTAPLNNVKSADPVLPSTKSNGRSSRRNSTLLKPSTGDSLGRRVSISSNHPPSANMGQSQSMSGIAAIVAPSAALAGIPRDRMGSASADMAPSASNESGTSLLKKVKKKVRSKHRSRKDTQASTISMPAEMQGSNRLRAGSTASRRSNKSDHSLSIKSAPGPDDLTESDEMDEEDETDSDELSLSGSRSSWHSRGSLPVTGFAVASNRRNCEFHAMFPEIDEGDYLIEDYGCALQKDILVQGRIYVSEHHLCFHSNIFGWVTNVVIPFREVTNIEKKMTAYVIPNAISIATNHGKSYTFASFISRDATYDVFVNVWHQSHSTESTDTESEEEGPERGAVDAGPSVGGAGTHHRVSSASHAPTQCSCEKAGKHYSEKVMEATFPSAPESIYSLLFTSPFLKDFMTNDQHLTDIQMSDWSPQTDDPSLLKRQMSYIKPLNGSIGPKSTRCEITDEAQHMEPDNYISMITTTRTPEVPSGTIFCVRTRTCLTWAGNWSTKVLVTTTVEWSGRSFIKGIIEKSAIEGQKTYHNAMEKAMREYIKKHASEFRRPGVEEDEVITQGPVVESPIEQESERTPAEQAEEQRRRQADEQRSALQSAVDSIVAGAKGIGSGIMIVSEFIGQLVGTLPVRRETILTFLIVGLLLTNVWTYSSLQSARKSPMRARHRLHLASTDTTALDDAVRRYFEMPISRDPDENRQLASACASSQGIIQLLDGLQTRIELMRNSLEQTDTAIERVAEEL